MENKSVKLEIVKPQVGIYFIFNNKVFYRSRDVKENNNSVSDDAGELFHYDLVKRALGTKSNPGDPLFIQQYQKGVEEYGEQGAFKIFPRGRVYYMYNEKKFYIAVPANHEFNKMLLYQIRRCFHITEKDCKYVADPFYNIY